jgi:hypothetical protein
MDSFKATEPLDSPYKDSSDDEGPYLVESSSNDTMVTITHTEPPLIIAAAPSNEIKVNHRVVILFKYTTTL